jgi:hypothetical protein
LESNKEQFDNVKNHRTPENKSQKTVQTNRLKFDRTRTESFNIEPMIGDILDEDFLSTNNKLMEACATVA